MPIETGQYHSSVNGPIGLKGLVSTSCVRVVVGLLRTGCNYVLIGRFGTNVHSEKVKAISFSSIKLVGLARSFCL